MNTNSKNFEDFSSKYENKFLLSDFLIDNYFKSVAKLYSGINHQKLTALEIGCGPGYSTQYLRQIISNDTAFEASEYLEQQITLAKKNNPNTIIKQENIYQLKRSDKSLDVIFLLEVLEHLEFPEAGLKEIDRVLNGSLIIGVPREPLWRILNFCRGKYLKNLGNTPGHIQHWSKNKFIKFVENYFGTVQEVSTPLPWTILRASNKI